VHLAQSTGHAISILNKIRIDVIITGILFPGLDRHLLQRLIKRRFKADVSVMVDSTEASGQQQDTGTGAVDYLCKPFELNDLQDSLERLIRRRNLEKFRLKFGYDGEAEAGTGEKNFSHTEYFLSGGRHTAAIIPEEEGLELMQKLGSLLREFRSLAGEADGDGTLIAGRENRYDPNRLFEVFDRLRPMDGCTLDYCLYRFDEFKLPYIYTRRIDAEPINDHGEFIRRFPHRRCRIGHIEAEPSPSGYFQLAVFYNTVSQFHLSRHCRPGLAHPVVAQDQLQRALDCIAGEAGRREIMRKYSLRSRLGVLMCEDVVKVIFIAFNPSRGLYFQHTYIRSDEIEHVAEIDIPGCDSSL